MSYPVGSYYFHDAKKNKNNVPFKGATWDIMQVYRGIIRRFSDRDYKCIFSSFVIRLLLTAKKENGWSIKLSVHVLISLIIHQVRTKKIGTVKRFGCPVSLYSLVFVFIEKIYQTLETTFHRLSKHLEFGQKYSTSCRIFNSLISVWISRWNTVSRVWYIISKVLLTVVLSYFCF